MRGLSTPVLGGLMIVAYTGLISSADGIIKLLSGGYEAAQIYVLAGGMVAVLSILVNWLCMSREAKRALPQLSIHQPLGQRTGPGGQRTGPGGQKPPSGVFAKYLPWRTACPRAMGLRSLAALLGAICFFYAFRLLPFAQVFLFIGLMPLLAGVMSGLILKERISFGAWIALGMGFVGVLFLFPSGVSSISGGHVLALVGATWGTFSMVMARYISRHDTNLLPQVFYPNLLLCLAMVPLLPVVWQPMPLADLAWALAYAGLLFAARWLAVAALRLLPAYVVTPLMNLQFVWMLTIGAWVFGEMPSQGTWIGGFIVIGSGLFLLRGQVVKPRARQRLLA
ncbi:DMT family transporter [Pseudophaeobacter arcticus]|mgnify:CR=1 FL=1|uniref:DMT family transporter n=1 Tax=Pseudophaeobacter arcticus TaxID=385492 RepID=UPI0024928D0F|nr:DMT family transporter [Pseudophaeobacter arcticus]